MKVMVTPKLPAFLAVLILSLIPAVLVNRLAGYLPFFTLLLCGILSMAQLLIIRKKMEYGISSGSELLTRGDAVKFGVEVTNRSRLPVVHMRAEFYIIGTDGKDDHVFPIRMTLSPGETRQFALDADFPHIGTYEAGFRKLILFDLFDNFRAVTEEGEGRMLDIQPKVFHLDSLPLSSQSVAESTRAASVSPLSGMDYSGVREYAYGDPIKMIQWKLSAHAGDLMTKQMESYTNTGVTVMIDLAVPLEYEEDSRLSMIDGVVETAVSAGQYAVNNGLDYVVLYSDEKQSAKNCTPQSFRDLRSWLPDFHAQDPAEVDAARFIRQAGTGRGQQSNVVYCTSRLTDEAVTALMELKRAKKNVLVYYLIPDTVYDVQRQALMAPLRKLRQAQISCYTGSGADQW